MVAVLFFDLPAHRSTFDGNWRPTVAISESLAIKQKAQARNGMGLLVSGMFLIVITLNWHSWLPSVIFRGKDWTDFLHGVVAGIALVIELTGMILLLRARTSASVSKS